MPEHSTSWVKRKHPEYDTWADDEKRMLATFHARRRDLVPYLELHRHEQNQKKNRKPKDLDRSDLGFGISLNESYLSEIFGHIRGAAAQHNWGPLGDTGESHEGAPEEGTTARKLWEDATRQNVNWRNFFGRTVLEDMLATPGSVVVCDVPPGRQDAASDDASRRPYVQNVPLSDVWDIGRSPTGIRWMKLIERRDRRAPDSEKNELDQNAIVYRLDDKGHTLVQRWSFDGGRIGDEIDMGQVVDRDGQPALPLVLNTFGSHPDVPWLGSGLLVGLDDIVIDMFNVVSEIRSGYRDLVLALLVYKGPDGDGVFDSLDAGTRCLDLGDDPNAQLDRLSPDSAEVDAGIAQLEMQLKAWARSAKRKASDFEESAQVRSGASLEAEYQIDLVPLLREVVEHLDNVESSVMHRLAQLDDDNARGDDLQSVGVTRAREFNPEDEASRIARIVSEFRDAFGDLGQSPEAKKSFMLRWLDATGEVDLDQDVRVGDGESEEEVPLREVIERQLDEATQDQATQRRNRAVGAGRSPLELR